MAANEAPRSGWDTEDTHLVGLPQSIQNNPDTYDIGFLGRICKRCAAIPWTELSGNPRYAADGDLRPAIEERRDELGESPCRICYLLGTIKAFGWLKYLGCVPAMPGSHFKGRLCFFPGEGVTPPAVAGPDLYGYLGIFDNLEVNLPIPRRSPEFVNLDIVRGWIARCAACHSKSCETDDPNQLQELRVIDCETLLIVHAPKSCAYVALSYVWGPPSEFEEEDYRFPLLPIRRSRTIDDAIKVTKQLGYRYLWVDRYCIDQKGPEHKMQQIKQMGAIYSSAELTIIAAAGDGPKHGLPGVSLPRQRPTTCTEVVGSVALVLTTVDVIDDVYNSTWAYRAWTFQEGYLSRRRLFFTNHTMLYVCNHDMKSDIMETDYMLGDIHGHRTLQQFLPWNSPMPSPEDWVVQSKNLSVAGKHIKAFSERRLTFDSDALNALLGILDRLSRSADDPVYHIWGVPLALYNRNVEGSSSKKESYEVALSWYHDVPCRRRAGFPTWSSFAWDGKSQYSYQDQLMVPDDIELRILSSGGSVSLEDYIKSGSVLRNSGSKQAPARLELVQVLAIPIRTVEIDGELTGGVIQLADTVDVVSYIMFDEAGYAVEEYLLGVLIYRDYGSKRMLLLILADRREYYERVGLSILDEDEIRMYTLKQGRVRDRKTGKVITDAQDLKETLKRPFQFVSESRQNVVMG